MRSTLNRTLVSISMQYKRHIVQAESCSLIELRNQGEIRVRGCQHSWKLREEILERKDTGKGESPNQHTHSPQITDWFWNHTCTRWDSKEPAGKHQLKGWKRLTSNLSSCPVLGRQSLEFKFCQVRRKWANTGQTMWSCFIEISWK